MTRPWPLERVLRHAASAVLLLFLLFFLALPVGSLLATAAGLDGSSLRDALALLADNPLYRESLIASLAVSLGAAALSIAAALPVVWLCWRRRLQPSLAVLLSGFLPLFVPPFMLSLSLQSLCGRGGALGMLSATSLDLDPSRWGLTGLAVIEAVHYAPFVAAVVAAGILPFARDAAEAARLGFTWQRLSLRVFLPLSLPGLAFAGAVVFLKTFDDLATPLSLGITNLIAPQIYFRATAYGADDMLSSLIALVMIAFSMAAWGLCAGRMRHGPTVWRAPDFASPAASRRSPLGFTLLAAFTGFYGLCYAGMLLTALARVWSHTLLPESFGLMHFSAALDTESASFINTLRYCGLAAMLDVVVGTAIAYAIRRSPTPSSSRLNWSIAGLLGVPGVALALAYLQFFKGVSLPLLGKSLDTASFLLPAALAVRGLPFAIPACIFALRNVPDATIEAALLSGAGRTRIALRIVLPLLAFGLSAAFLICFGIAAVDLSSAMLLVPSETDAPAAYTIYLNMQTTTGRGTGSALAVLAVAAVGLALVVATRCVRHHPAPPPGTGAMQAPSMKAP